MRVDNGDADYDVGGMLLFMARAGAHVHRFRNSRWIRMVRPWLFSACFHYFAKTKMALVRSDILVAHSHTIR